MSLTLEDFIEKMEEIEELHRKVGDILYSKNPFVRIFKFNKAIRLHNLASDKIRELFSDIEKI